MSRRLWARVATNGETLDFSFLFFRHFVIILIHFNFVFLDIYWRIFIANDYHFSPPRPSKHDEIAQLSLNRTPHIQLITTRARVLPEHLLAAWKHRQRVWRNRATVHSVTCRKTKKSSVPKSFSKKRKRYSMENKGGTVSQSNAERLRSKPSPNLKNAQPFRVRTPPTPGFNRQETEHLQFGGAFRGDESHEWILRTQHFNKRDRFKFEWSLRRCPCASAPVNRASNSAPAKQELQVQSPGLIVRTVEERVKTSIKSVAL